MALITSYKVTATNSSPTFAPAAANDTAKVNKRGILLVHNGSGVTRTVTLTAQGSAENGTPLADTDVDVEAGATATIYVGLDMYRNENQEVEISYSSVTDVTRAVLEV